MKTHTLILTMTALLVSGCAKTSDVRNQAAQIEALNAKIENLASLLDAETKRRIDVSKNEFKELYIVDGKGVRRIFLGVDEANVARIRLFSPDAKTRLGLFSYPANHATFPDLAGLGITDSFGKERVQLMSQNRSLPSLVRVNDAEGNTRVVNYSSGPNSGELSFDHNGKLRIGSWTDAAGIAFQFHTDGAGVERFKLKSGFSNSDFEDFTWESEGSKAWKTTGDVMQAVELLQMLFGDSKE